MALIMEGNHEVRIPDRETERSQQGCCAILGGAIAILALSVSIGTVVFHSFEHEADANAWAHAFHQTASYLGGFEAIHRPTTWGGMIWNGVFALYAGLIFVATPGIVVAPVLHRVLHWLHWDKFRHKETSLI